MKKSLILASCAAITFGLAGCTANNNAANDNNDNGQQRVQTSQVRRGPATENNRLQLADRAERQVEQMAEVDDARVIISENNAYVAVRLAGGNNDNYGNADVNNALDGNGRTFAENGRVDQDDNRAGNDGIIDGKGDAGNGNRQNVGTDRNTVSRNGLESEIEQKVRQAHRGIDNVYVSVDNNAFDRMGTFADDIRNNRNRDGMFEDFRDTMNNFFGR
ncbi:YhcN/YlaJ family sporulation lipoprotein [Mesobacillus boroniphilus]|uniref:YhcN/YlaJ family sporulation lipoprotein n=1 Tax=Mesobacillus boroniphilus TaxID=308892 RepID=UPI001BD0ECFA